MGVIYIGIELWFDVGIKRYTTNLLIKQVKIQLWFDVGIKRYTTGRAAARRSRSCGLM